jgi:molybdate/tungstate transport system substrate-binding protein
MFPAAPTPISCRTAVQRLALAAIAVVCAACQPRPRELVVFNAAALGPSFRALGLELKAQAALPGVAQENAPSLEVVRKLTELGKIPDVLAVADVSLLDSLVVPRFSSWYLVFASNALVLAYGPGSAHRADVGRVPWHELLLRPGVRVGRSDPLVDPSGYRTLLVLQLAERFYQRQGLAAELLRAMPERYVRRAEADLSALIQSGELDYVWTYRNLAEAHGLEWIELAPELSLESAELAEWYATASLELPARDGRPGLQVRGAPILFALTIPRAAASPELAEVFVRALFTPEGRNAVASGGLRLLEQPRVVGEGAPPGLVAAIGADAPL